ncbi:MAG: PH domain-containing protein [Cocleimonas sp.]|nr:PH domain-containing protein [Cocleimonas sp.]
MFKNIAADVLGLSDIGKIIAPEDFDKTDVDDYVFTEDNEKIYAVIKSRSDEYCFTNTAFIHLDGLLAISKKRTLKRYPYRHYTLSDIYIETAGTVDLDAELKFSTGGTPLSIDIDKRQIEKLKDIYKALYAISEECLEIKCRMETLKYTHHAVCNMFALREMSDQIILELPEVVTQTATQVEQHYNQRQKDILNYDFSDIFEKYLDWETRKEIA